MVMVYGGLWAYGYLRSRGELLAFRLGYTWGTRHMSQPESDDDTIHEITPQTFTGSALFERTFDEGMALVEETARYLDGRGRREARELPRNAAMLYAGESMRVTTR